MLHFTQSWTRKTGNRQLRTAPRPLLSMCHSGHVRNRFDQILDQFHQRLIGQQNIHRHPAWLAGLAAEATQQKGTVRLGTQQNFKK
jgi:hypothetical protein